MLSMLFWRFLVSSLVVGLLIICTSKTTHDNRSALLKVLFYGGALYTATTITYFISSLYIGTGLAMVIFFTYPAIIMLFNWALYRKPIPKIYYAAVALIIIGLLLLTDIRGMKYDLLGIGAGILSALFYAGYIISSKKNIVSPLISTFMVSLGSTAIFFLLTLMSHSFVLPSALGVWGNIFGMGIICTALPILLLLEGLKYISEEKASILSVLEPVFVVFFGVALLGESINIMQIAGIITILSGALITLLSSKSDN